MSYDEFFTDGDKPYAENLNDSLALLDAFDVTVPCEMPTMFNNGQFGSSTNVARKCGVGIVTLKSASSGITIGNSSISGSGTVVFRVYPNFNAFYKWQSIILTKTGTVNVSFAKTDGTSISTTIANDGTISEVAALKTLQEIDVTLTLSSATITKILINFVNNQNTRTRTGALLDANQLTNVNGSVASGNTKAVSGGTVYTALNSFLSTVYPVGSVYISVNNTNPGTLFGGTWQQIPGQFLLGAGTTPSTSKTYTAGSSGGSKDAVVVSHTHTSNDHSHTMANNKKFLSSDDDIKVNTRKTALGTTNNSGVYKVYSETSTGINQSTTTGSTAATINSTGVDGTDMNMPPYLVVYMWKRTA